MTIFVSIAAIGTVNIQLSLVQKTPLHIVSEREWREIPAAVLLYGGCNKTPHCKETSSSRCGEKNGKHCPPHFRIHDYGRYRDFGQSPQVSSTMFCASRMNEALVRHVFAALSGVATSQVPTDKEFAP